MMGFDERQMAIVDYILEHGRVTNTNVQEMFKGPGAGVEPKEIWAQGREELLTLLTDYR